MINNSKLSFLHGQIISPSETIQDGFVGISTDGSIDAIQRSQPETELGGTKMDLNGKILIPGMIDIHVHGGFGVSFGEGALAPDLEKYSRFAASHGVTGFLLSITGPNADAITQILKEYVQI